MVRGSRLATFQHARPCPLLAWLSGEGFGRRLERGLARLDVHPTLTQFHTEGRIEVVPPALESRRLGGPK